MRRLGLIVVFALVGIPSVASAERVPLSQVPEPARRTIEARARGGKVVEVERDHDRGRIYYEAQIVRKGITTEVSVAPDGSILRIEPDHD